MTRVLELDGVLVEVNCCNDCPLLEERAEELVPWCKHPLRNAMVTIDVLEEGRVADDCPLREKRTGAVESMAYTLTYTWTCSGCHMLCHRAVPVCPRCGREVA